MRTERAVAASGHLDGRRVVAVLAGRCSYHVEQPDEVVVAAARREEAVAEPRGPAGGALAVAADVIGTLGCWTGWVRRARRPVTL